METLYKSIINFFYEKFKQLEQRALDLLKPKYVQLAPDPYFEQFKKDFCEKYNLTEQEFYRLLYRDIRELARFVEESVRVGNLTRK